MNGSLFVGLPCRLSPFCRAMTGKKRCAENAFLVNGFYSKIPRGFRRLPVGAGTIRYWSLSVPGSPNVNELSWSGGSKYRSYLCPCALNSVFANC